MPEGYHFINKEFISRLIKRFTLGDTPRTPEAWPLFKIVLGVTQVDELLKTNQCQSLSTTTRTAVEGVGSHLVFTVPAGKRLTFYAMYASRLTGDAQMDEFLVGVATAVLRVFSITATNAMHTEMLNQPVTLDEGQTVWVNVSSITGDSNIEFRGLYIEEDAYRA